MIPASGPERSAHFARVAQARWSKPRPVVDKRVRTFPAGSAIEQRWIQRAEDLGLAYEGMSHTAHRRLARRLSVDDLARKTHRIHEPRPASITDDDELLVVHLAAEAARMRSRALRDYRIARDHDELADRAEQDLATDVQTRVDLVTVPRSPADIEADFVKILSTINSTDLVQIEAVGNAIARRIPAELIGSKEAMRQSLEMAPEAIGDELRAMRKAFKRGYRRGAYLRSIAPLEPVSKLVEAYEYEERKARKRQDRQMVRELAVEEAGDVEDGTADYTDVAALIENGIEDRVPDAGGIRNDGTRMGYRGKTHALIGPPESGKTLVSIAMACDELKEGGNVLHLDADDNGAADTIAKYLAFGVAPEILSNPTRFRFVEVRTADHVRRVVSDAAEWLPTHVTIDAVGEFMPLWGLSSMSDDEYRQWHREVPKSLSKLGAAVWVIDHVTKAEGSSNGYASGTHAKKGALSGVSYSVTCIEEFAPGREGAAAIKILKDRVGGVRATSPEGKNPTAAVFRLDSRGGASTWEFWKGRPEEERVAEQSEADVVFVLGLAPFPTSRAALQAALKASQGKGWRDGRANAALIEARRRRESVTTFPANPNPIETKE